MFYAILLLIALFHLFILVGYSWMPSKVAIRYDFLAETFLFFVAAATLRYFGW